MKFLVIGESCLDVFVYGHVVRLAPEAPVPVFNSENVVTNPGMASNVERNIRALGCDVTLFTNPDWKSIKKIRYVESKSNHIFLRVDERDGAYGKSDIGSVPFEEYDCVVVSDYGKGWLSPEQINLIGHRAKISVLDTKKILGDWASSITFIKINESEYERTRSVLSNKIVDKLIVTLGPQGAMFQGRIFPCEEVSRVDSCGAGDTFVSAFAKSYAETGSVDDAIRYGNEVASMVVQKRGVSTL